MGFNGGLANLASQLLTLNGGSTFVDRGDANISESGGSTTTININGTSRMSSQNRMLIGMAANSTGAVSVANSGKLTVSNG